MAATEKMCFEGTAGALGVVSGGAWELSWGSEDRPPTMLLHPMAGSLPAIAPTSLLEKKVTNGLLSLIRCLQSSSESLEYEIFWDTLSQSVSICRPKV